MPLTIPSTAWSSAQSSKTMFAALPPSSSVSFLPVPASSRWIALPTSVEPVNAILSTSPSTIAAPVRPSPVTMLTTPGGSSAWRTTSQKSSAVSGRRLGRLEHDRVPARERRRDLPREHQQREVPRDDLAGDADRPRAAVRERVLELVGPARVVEEVRGGERQVDVARLLDRLAAVQRLEHRELARALLQDPRDPEQVLRALGAGQRRPAVLERRARDADRLLHLLGGRLADLGERLLGRRRDRRVRLARLEPLAADEVAVALVEPDDVARLGRGRVVPARGDERLLLRLLLEVSQR